MAHALALLELFLQLLIVGILLGALSEWAVKQFLRRRHD